MLTEHKLIFRYLLRGKQVKMSSNLQSQLFELRNKIDRNIDSALNTIEHELKTNGLKLDEKFKSYFLKAISNR